MMLLDLSQHLTSKSLSKKGFYYPAVQFISTDNMNYLSPAISLWVYKAGNSNSKADNTSFHACLCQISLCISIARCISERVCPSFFRVSFQHWAKWDMAPLSLWGGLSTMPLFQYPSTWTGLFTTLLCHYTVHILCCLHNWRNGEERMQKPEYFWNADFCLLIQVLWIALHLMQLELHYIHNKMWDLILWKKL